MDEEKGMLHKLDELETEYQKQQKKIEQKLDDVVSEKDNFHRDIENLGNDLRNLVRKKEYDIDVRQANYMIESAQEEGTFLHKTLCNTLEADQEDLTRDYQKKVRFYEEELAFISRKEE